MADGMIKSVNYKFFLYVVLLFPALSFADDIDHDEAYRLQQAGKILPLERILEKSRQYHEGKILEVELNKKRNTFIYEIEILDNEGVLWEMKVNAVDGSLVSQEGED